MTDKILIIKPAYTAWPVGFAYVLACLEANNIPFDFIDASRSQNLRKDIKKMLTGNSYFAVASGGLIGFFHFFREIARLARKYQPGIPFILGGNITKDGFSDLLFKYIGMNYGIVGEAETSLPGLIQAIINKDGNIAAMPGIVCRDAGGNMIRNPPQRFDLKNNSILPAWHRFDVEFYTKSCSVPFIGDLNFMPVLTGRGCVGKCTFCSPSIGGFRKRPIEQVIYEIEYLNSKYDFDNIMFYNEMFYPTAREIRDFCLRYKELKVKKSWITQVRVDANIDVDTFALMKESGCCIVSAGIESGSDKVLALMNKKVTSEQIRVFFRNAKVANLPSNGTFMVGNEGETEEDLKKTIDLVIDEEINTGESLIYVYSGTAVYQNALKRGLVKNEMQHLKKMARNIASLFSPNVKGNYLNMSNIPDDQFLDIATREVRRYHTFVFNRYPVRDLSCKIDIQGKQVLMTMDGKCHECGADVRNTYNIYNRAEYVGLLGAGVHDRYICPKCFSQLSFNIYTCREMEGLGEYFASLKERLAGKNRIIIGGLNEDARFLLRINLFGLDYKKILGFAGLAGWRGAGSYVNYPVFNIDDVVNLKPDCILMLDGISDGENIIRKIYYKKQLPPPEFFYLVNQKLLGTLKTIESAGGYGSRYNQLIIWLKYKYLSLRDFCDDKDIHIPGFLSDFAEYFKKNIFVNKR